MSVVGQDRARRWFTVWGKACQKRMEKQGKSLRDLEAECGYSVATIQRAITGNVVNPNLMVVLLISEALGLGLILRDDTPQSV